MRPKLKRIDRQVIVITGASSGIGLATARLAAARGAKLVLVARNGEALQQIATELGDGGAQVEWVVADVADEDALRAAATRAIESFGGFDTWINNAGISIFGMSEDVARDDQRRLFDTNFWGVVNGSMLALEHLRTHGGALINIGSELSDLSVPLQGIYSASKHAVKGFTDALRMEIEHSGYPVSVTLVKPAGIDTLFVQHARNYMDVEARLPSPVYAPEVVARAILSACERPQRDVYVGAPARLMSIAARLVPRAVDRIGAHAMYRQQRTDTPERSPERHSLYAAGRDQQVSGNRQGPVLQSSLYTDLTQHKPLVLGVALGAAAAAAAAIAASRQRARRSPLH